MKARNLTFIMSNIQEMFFKAFHGFGYLTLFLILFTFAEKLNAQVEIDVTVNKTDVLTCESMLYTLSYRCAGTTTNCDNVTMTASAPSGMVFPNQVVGLTTDIQSYSFSSDRRSITFIFKNPLLAGTNGSR